MKQFKQVLKYESQSIQKKVYVNAQYFDIKSNLPRLGDIWYIILFYDCPKELWEKRQESEAMGILYFASFVGKNSTLPK